MEQQEIIKLAASQGLWAVLFVVLLFWVLRENAKREADYRTLLFEMTDKYGILEDVREDVGDVKKDVGEVKTVTYRIKEKIVGG